MAIKIDLYSLEIPVSIGGLSFTTTMDDESLIKMHEVVSEVVNEARGKEDEDVEYIKSLLSKAFDIILGDNAFEMIYEKTPSTMVLCSALLALSEGLESEYASRKAKLIKKPKFKNKKGNNHVQPD